MNNLRAWRHSSPGLKWLSLRLAVLRNPDLVFWVCFLALNGLLFLPSYLLNREITTFLPASSTSLKDPVAAIKELVLWRNNLDPFRLNAEVVLLTALWLNVGWSRKPNSRRIFRWFFVAFYLVALSYYVYESIMRSLYQVDPVFYSHYRLIVEGVQFVARHLHVATGVYLVGGLALVAGPVIIAKSIHLMIEGVAVERLSRWSRIGLTLIALSVIVAGLKYHGLLASPKMVVSSFAFKLQQNVNDSLEEFHNVQRLGDITPGTAYDYSDYELLDKPNIYLIFVESYGSVLYKRSDYMEAYTSLANRLQRQLDAGGWHVASALSEAPVWGGGSWMSYTSALFGMRINNHPQYLSLLDRYQAVDYPDLGHYLRGQGYEYVRLSSLSVDLKQEEWLKYENFYGVDRWLRYKDLEYVGAHYGWGPSPPDQYALHFAYDRILSHLDKPLLFFFITQNSHYPWVPLPSLVDDWRTLNSSAATQPVAPPDPIPHEIRRGNYFNSIVYQLEFLTDFILEKGDEKSIFVLIGDHQPQRVSRRDDGFDTPVHIISQDVDFVDAFQKFDFVSGLVVPDATPVMRHEGFYSMFMQVLLGRYGQGIRVLPDYLPHGITPMDDSEAQIQGDG